MQLILMQKLNFDPHQLVVTVDKRKHNKLKVRLLVHEKKTISESVRDFMDEKLNELPPAPNEE